MKRIVFTGAGASKALGFPLTNDLMPKIINRISGRLARHQANPSAGLLHTKAAKQDMLIHDCLHVLYPGIFENNASIPSITDVLSLIDFAIEGSGGLPIGSKSRLMEFRQALIVSLSKFIQDSDELDTDKLGVKFATFISQSTIPTLISTNYDIAIDRELYDRNRIHNNPNSVDIGFDWLDANDDNYRLIVRPEKPKLRVYKLHGSFDMLRCPICGHTWFNYYGNIIHQSYDAKPYELNTCRCTDTIVLESNIVAMSYSRQITDPTIHQIWRSAYDALVEADEWVMVGYSLPAEDIGIRSLLIRAHHEKRVTRKKPPIVTVVQHGHSAEPTYRSLFPNCRYYADGLENFLSSNSDKPGRAGPYKKRRAKQRAT